MMQAAVVSAATTVVVGRHMVQLIFLEMYQCGELIVRYRGFLFGDVSSGNIDGQFLIRTRSFGRVGFQSSV